VECTNKDQANPRINVFVNIQYTTHTVLMQNLLKSIINSVNLSWPLLACHVLLTYIFTRIRFHCKQQLAHFHTKDVKTKVRQLPSLTWFYPKFLVFVLIENHFALDPNVLALLTAFSTTIYCRWRC